MKHYAENLGSNVGAMIKVRQVVNFFLFFNNNNFFRTFEALCCLKIPVLYNPLCQYSCSVMSTF